MTRFLLVPFILGLVSPTLALAGDGILHSGHVVAINTTAHTLTLAEMGSWRGEKTLPVTRTVEFGPGTKFELVMRAQGANPQGWVGGYVESTIDPAVVRPGDFVTVSLEGGENGREATMVQVVKIAGTRG